MLRLTKLEERSGMSRESFLAIEQGNRMRGHPGKIQKLTEALEVDQRELLKHE